MESKADWKKIITEICRICLGVVFIFSGFVKAVDPWGTAYKNMEYFEAFGMHELEFTAMPFAILQLAVEFGLGIFLLFGVYRRFNTIFSLVFMLFMTPLTLYLAIKNPVTDCGCFGDALVITNWQTFIKNIFLLAAAVVVFLWYKKIMPVFSHKAYTSVVIWAYAFIVGYAFYNYSNLPMIDFRPYKTGANIPKLMTVPENAESDVYETVLIYKKDGKEQEFTLQNYPKDDTWEFVDQKSKLLKKGYEPPIHDFTITTDSEDDITYEVLSDTSYTFLLISTKFSDASDVHSYRINALYEYSKQMGYGFYALTSSTAADIADWRKSTGAEYPICTADNTTLKTIIRSNPGLLLLKDGTIINKWANNDIPKQQTLNNRLEDSPLGKTPRRYTGLKVLLTFIIFSIPLGILYIIDFERRQRKHIRKTKNE